jgi:lysophospholipid acyltransferase (LPLAT)-like uncharacterized protein
MNEILHISLDGQEAAVLISEIPHRHHQMYKVTLENGYSNIFFTDVETGQWVEEDLGFTNLARQIGNQVRGLQFKTIHVPKLLNWHKVIIREKPVAFGFFCFMHGSYKMFEIYNSNKKYMYTLVEMHEEWQILNNNEARLENIDPSFIHEITKVLPLYADFE